MQDSGLGLILDVLIVVLLSATIYFAARLSVYLKNFRQGRAEMDTLVRTLSESVLRAQEAITGMQQTADDAGKELQRLIDASLEISEELQLINEAGNNLATRLEGVAERNRRIAEQIDASSGFSPDTRDRTSSGSSTIKTKADPSDSPFVIRDPEFDAWNDDFDEEEDDTGFFFSDDDDKGWDEESLMSQAEKELHAALHGGKSKRRIVRKH